MNIVFFLLFLLSIIGFCIGLVKPSVFKLKNRKQTSLIFGGSIVIFFILFGVTAPQDQSATTSSVTNVQAKPVPATTQVPLTDEQKVENAVVPLLEQSSLQASYRTDDYSYIMSDNPEVPSDKQQDAEIGVDTGPVSDLTSYITETGVLTTNIFQQVFQLNPNFVYVNVFYWGPTIDQYGNATTSELMTYGMSRELYGKINWSGLSEVQNDIHLCAFLREQYDLETPDEQINDVEAECGVMPYDLMAAEDKIETSNPQYANIPHY